jgi:serine-type D-Ala-D-Ala carboxypeptidase/endopeptidase (penicillin-binding protein 4)
VPAGTPPHSFGVALDRSAEYCAALLKQLLEARGVKIYGVAAARHAPRTQSSDPSAAAATTDSRVPGNMVLAEHVSWPLSEAVRVANKVSQNLHAEMLLRDASRERSGDGTLDGALQFAEAFRASAGIAPDDVVLTDGSGLSRRDLVTPAAVVRLLGWASQQSWGQLYRDSLPVAGQEGTLSERMQHTAAAGRIAAKTGTSTHTDALSGYATSVRGEHLLFAFFVNNDTLSTESAEKALDSIAVAMVETLGQPRAAKKK